MNVSKPVTWSLFAVWFGLFVWSFISIQMTEPTGSGFTRGLNRLGDFFLFQAIAMGLALLAWLVGLVSGHTADWPVRLARYVPLGVSGLFWLVVVGFYGFLFYGT